jgi:hypothetical protein
VESAICDRGIIYSDLLHVDAVTLETEGKFNCIYSHRELIASYAGRVDEVLSQAIGILNFGGILSYTFWHSDTEEKYNGLYFLILHPR